ncbi:hypothetical protein [Mycobacteroides abscessus]|nr:hypothetical protein [Mycobacteroides abscessus]
MITLAAKQASDEAGVVVMVDNLHRIQAAGSALVTERIDQFIKDPPQ